MTKQATQKAAEKANEQAKAAMKANQETVEKAVNASKETVENAVKTSKETTDKAMKAGEEALTKGYDQTVATLKEQVQKTFPEAADRFDEFAAFQKDNIAAFFAASNVAAEGFQKLADEVIAYNQQAFDSSVAAAQKLLDTKTVQDAVEVQSDFARSSFDRLVAETTKVSELTVKVTNDATGPLQARANKAAEIFSKPIAS